MNFTKDFTWDFTKDFFSGFDYCWIIKFLSRNSKLITEILGGWGEREVDNLQFLSRNSKLITDNLMGRVGVN